MTALAALVSALILTGCGGGGGGTPAATATVIGFVLNAGSHALITGASVTGAGQTVATLTDGSFTLTNVPLATLALTISAAGLVGGSYSVAVGTTYVNAGQFLLAPQHVAGTGNVQGQVTVDGFAASAATVRAPGGTPSATADANGAYTLYNCPAGLQQLTVASSNGAAVKFYNVTVPVDGTISNVNIALTTGPPPPPFP